MTSHAAILPDIDPADYCLLSNIKNYFEEKNMFYKRRNGT